METSEAVEYIEVPPGDSRYRTVMQIIRNSFLDPHYQPSWIVQSLQTVKNLKLFQHYKNKSEELSRCGRDVTEYDMFTCYKTVDLIKNILEHGLQTRQSSFNFLGNSQKGVNLCRHADIQLKAAENTGQEECYLIIYKVMLGKALPVYPSPDNQQLAPTENFDSHISSLAVDRSIPLGQQAIRSQVFCYEYINGQLSSCPRHVLPYVVICYKRPMQASMRSPSMNMPLQRPTIQPPPPPLVQMAPAPQPPAVSGLYQHCPNSGVTTLADFQPRLPPRNPFRMQNFPVYQTDARSPYPAGPGIRMTETCQALPIMNISSTSMIVPVVPQSIQQSTGMRLPYISVQPQPPPPPLLDPGNRLVFNQNEHSQYPARVSLPSLAQPMVAQQSYSIFNNTTRVTTTHTGMSIPLQLPSSEEINPNAESDFIQREPKQVIGMRLPIIIQPEEQNQDETSSSSLAEQLMEEPHRVHMQLPTILTTEPSAFSKQAIATDSTRRPQSPKDIKPDISKIRLNGPKRKTLTSEEICIDVDEEPVGTSTCQAPELARVEPVVITPSSEPGGVGDGTDLSKVRSNRQLLDAVTVPSSQQVVTCSADLDKSSVHKSSKKGGYDSTQECDVQAFSVKGIKGRNTSLKTHPELEVMESKINKKETRNDKTSLLDLGDDGHAVEEESNENNPQKDGYLLIFKKLKIINQSVSNQDQVEDDDTLPDLSVDDSGSDDLCSPDANKPHAAKDIESAGAEKHLKMPNGKIQCIVEKLKRQRPKHFALCEQLRRIHKGYRRGKCKPLDVKERFCTSFYQKPVFQICKNGSVQLFYDICKQAAKKRNKSKRRTRAVRQKAVLLFDEVLSDSEISILLKDVDTEYVDLELTRNESRHCDLYKEDETETVGHSDEPNTSGDRGDSFEMARNDETFTTDCHLDASDGMDGWKTVIEDDRFQPKVVVTNIMSPSSEWNTLLPKERQTGIKEEQEDNLDLHIAHVESLHDSSSDVPSNKADQKESEAPEDGSHFMEEDFDSELDCSLVIDTRSDSNDPDNCCSTPEEEEEARPEGENPTDPNETPAAGGGTSERAAPVEGDGEHSSRDKDPTSSDGDRCTEADSEDSFISLVREKRELEKALRRLEKVDSDSQAPRSSSNSPVIDTAQLESWGTRLSLLRDLNKDGSTQKSSLVLSKLSQVRRELGGTERTTTSKDDGSTLDLFLDEKEVITAAAHEKAGGTERPSSDLEQQGNDSGGKDPVSGRPFSSQSKDISSPTNRMVHSRKYKYSPYRHRYLEHSKKHRSSLDGSSKHKKQHHHEGNRKRHSSRDGRSSHKNKRHISSRSFTSSQSPLSPATGHKRSYSASEAMDSCDGEAPSHETRARKRSKSTTEERESSSKHPKREGDEKNNCDSRGRSRSNENETDSGRMDKEETTKSLRRERNNSGDQMENIDTSSRDRGLEERDQSIRTSEERNQMDDGSEKMKRSSGETETSGTELPRPATEGALSSQAAAKKQPMQINEKWVETCERLYLGRSGKEGSPLFDGYSNISDQSTAADPSEWLNKLIRINTKRTSYCSSKRAAVSATEKAMSTAQSSVMTSNAEGLKPVGDGTCTKNDGGSSFSKEAVVPNGEPQGSRKSEVMTREELTDLVSRALTILKPSEVAGTPADNSQAQFTAYGSVPDQSDPDRLSNKYPHRRRKNGPTVCTQSKSETSSQPKLWGTQSLEEMHSKAACQEPVFSSLPSYQSIPSLSSPEPEGRHGLGLTVDVDIHRSPTAHRINCAVSSTTALSPDVAVQSRDPRLRRLSLSPRAESGSDIENVFQSPLSTDSSIRESPTGSMGEAETTGKPKNKISKLWEASISAPKALGNESVAFRELKGKDKRSEQIPIGSSSRRSSASEKLERKLSVDERFANYPPWKRELKSIDIPSEVCYKNLEQTLEARDPRLNIKRATADGELVKRTTKHCRSIPLECVKRDNAKQNGKSCNDGQRSANGSSSTPEDVPLKKDADLEHDSGAHSGSSSSCSGSDTADGTAAKRHVVKGTKGAGSASCWTPRAHLDIGSSSTLTRSVMDELQQLDASQYQTVNDEMTRLLNARIQSIEDSLRFSDPTKGLDQQRRLKLMMSGGVNDSVTKELRIEEEMRLIREENRLMRQKLDDALRTKSLSDSAVKELKFQIDIRDIKYERHNKELEKLGRFYKSSVVEVLPDMFRLEEEKHKFISVEGNMMFLMSKLKDVDCKRLLGLLEEIKEHKAVYEKPSTPFEDKQQARWRLGWLHNERRETLCQLCLNLSHAKQTLLQRFLDKLSWCNKVESVLQHCHESDDLLSYIRERSRNLDRYIGVLKNVQRLDNGVWTAKVSQACGEDRLQLNASICDAKLLLEDKDNDDGGGERRDASDAKMDCDADQCPPEAIRHKRADGPTTPATPYAGHSKTADEGGHGRSGEVATSPAGKMDADVVVDCCSGQQLEGVERAANSYEQRSSPSADSLSGQCLEGCDKNAEDRNTKVNKTTVSDHFQATDGGEIGKDEYCGLDEATPGDEDRTEDSSQLSQNRKPNHWSSSDSGVIICSNKEKHRDVGMSEDECKQGHCRIDLSADQRSPVESRCGSDGIPFATVGDVDLRTDICSSSEASSRSSSCESHPAGSPLGKQDAFVHGGSLKKDHPEEDAKGDDGVLGSCRNGHGDVDWRPILSEEAKEQSTVGVSTPVEPGPPSSRTELTGCHDADGSCHSNPGRSSQMSKSARRRRRKRKKKHARQLPPCSSFGIASGFSVISASTLLAKAKVFRKPSTTTAPASGGAATEYEDSCQTGADYFPFNVRRERMEAQEEGNCQQNRGQSYLSHAHADYRFGGGVHDPGEYRYPGQQPVPNSYVPDQRYAVRRYRNRRKAFRYASGGNNRARF